MYFNTFTAFSSWAVNTVRVSVRFCIFYLRRGSCTYSALATPLFAILYHTRWSINRTKFIWRCAQEGAKYLRSCAVKRSLCGAICDGDFITYSLLSLKFKRFWNRSECGDVTSSWCIFAAHWPVARFYAPPCIVQDATNDNQSVDQSINQSINQSIYWRKGQTTVGVVIKTQVYIE